MAVATRNDLAGEAAPSPAGPLDAPQRPPPPLVALDRLRTTLRLSQRQTACLAAARRRHGDVFRMHGHIQPDPIVFTCHPDHVRSLLTARPQDAPSNTGESPLRSVVGPGSVLTALGDRHLRQRRLLLPPFHGEAVARYSRMIREAAEREVDRWSPGETLQLASRMQDVTLDVIMTGIFGVEGRAPAGTPEDALRRAVRRLARLSVSPLGQAAMLVNLRSDRPIGLQRLALQPVYDAIGAAIAARRRDGDASRADVLSLLLEATTEAGERLTDAELRDELVGLVLAGHETTANQLAWTFERLTRTPAAHDALRHAVRAGDDAAAWVEATLQEAQRSRPVVPVIGRRVRRPWRLGAYDVPAGQVVLVSIALLHHREDVYPEPHAFRPERFLDRKPGTYTWLPFGGGIRRCLGAALAQAEMRIALETIARRADLRAAEAAPERPLHRNVTMLPGDGARVVVDAVA
jgi:cytochrome P450